MCDSGNAMAATLRKRFLVILKARENLKQFSLCPDLNFKFSALESNNLQAGLRRFGQTASGSFGKRLIYKRFLHFMRPADGPPSIRKNSNVFCEKVLTR